MARVSVVIPVYKHYSLLHTLLYDLYCYCRSSIDEVIIVNDENTDLEVYEGIQWWKKQKMLPIRVLDMEENVGFLKASNSGLRMADGDIVILVSTDVRIQENIIPTIVHKLEENPKSLIGGKLYSGSTGWNQFGSRIFGYLEGWLLATSKKNWIELGYFDERYVPNDYEDVDLSTTAIDKGFTLVELVSARLTHMGAQSIGYSPERESLTKINQKKFEAKWLLNR